MAAERLQKVLAAAGLGSRRSCEELIAQGRVTVDGEIVTEMGTKVDVAVQTVCCDGEGVRPARKVYYLVNKPMGVVCTNDDERGRPRVIDLLPHRDERLFTIGRLDANTEGLLLVTNDGAFAQRVAHPRHGMTKTYHARVHGRVSAAAISSLLEGVWIAGHRCRAAAARILKQKRAEAELEVTMQEGRKREVRRMLARVGHRVAHLRRIRIGPLSDPELRVGKSRKLNAAEVKELLDFRPGPEKEHGQPRGARSKSMRKDR